LAEAKRSGKRERLDEVREGMAAEGRRNLHFLATVVLGYRWLTGPEGLHGRMCRHLQGEEGACPRRALEVFRGAGKSLLLVSWMIQRLLLDRQAAVLLVCARQTEAILRVRAVMEHIEGNAMLRWVYPELRPDRSLWKKDRGLAMVARGPVSGRAADPTLRAASVETGLTGGHPTDIGWDDLVIPEDVRTAAAREGVLETYRKWSPLKRFADAHQRLNCTPHHEQDANRWIQRNERWDWLRVPAITKWPDGVLAWPEVFTKERLEEERRKDPETFSSQYLLELVTPELQVIKRGWFRYRDVPDSPQTWYVACDPAWGVGADETGVVLVGVDRDGMIQVEDDLSGQIGEAELITLLFELVAARQIDAVAFEGMGPFAALEKTLQAEMVQRDVYFELVRVTHTAEKAARIRTVLRPLYQAGRIYHASSLQGGDLELQLLKLTARGTSGRDDRMDALAMAVQLARERGWFGEGPSRKREEIVWRPGQSVVGLEEKDLLRARAHVDFGYAGGGKAW